MIQLGFKKLRNSVKPTVIEVRQHSNILEIKMLIYISMSCPHSQLDCLMRLESIHPALIFLLSQLILFPQGTKNNYFIVPHSTVYITFCTFQPEKRHSVVLGHMAS